MIKFSNYKYLLMLVFFSVMLFFIGSCDSRRVYDKNVEIHDKIWDKDSIKQFVVDVKDTLSLYNIFINIRNGGDYPKSNLYLFINTKTAGVFMRDTFECVLADESGKWYGSGIGDIWSHQIPYKQNIRFPYKGLYVFEFEQAMRTTKLPGVYNVGLRIERSRYQTQEQDSK